MTVRRVLPPLEKGRVGVGIKSKYRAGAQIDSRIARLGKQGRNQRSILDHMRKRLARRDLAAESKKGRTHRVIEL